LPLRGRETRCGEHEPPETPERGRIDEQSRPTSTAPGSDRLETFVRVEQKDWNQPVREEWVGTLEAAVDKAGDHVILVAHSLACLLVAHWAAAASATIGASSAIGASASIGVKPRNRMKVKGAFLVGMVDPDCPAFPKAAGSFTPVSFRPLPFPSLIVASTDDPYGTPEFARYCARAWGGGIVLIGAKGHINAESGLGTWEEGRRLLDSFTLL